MKIIKTCAVVALTLVLGCSSQSPKPAMARSHPRPEAGSELGELHHPVTTKNPVAQPEFDEGLTLIYAFSGGIHPVALITQLGGFLMSTFGMTVGARGVRVGIT